MQRRLAAILVADVAGFSALVAADEEGTIRTFRGHLAIMEPLIALHSGRIVKHTGDGYLAEFASVVDAVSCADTMQKEMAERNRAHDGPARVVFRIGIHAGDIIGEGDDILGDGVNIAARLEALAPPGGIAISARVREDLSGKLDLAFEDLGPVTLKNIPRPVHVFGVSYGTAPPRPVEVSVPDKPSLAVLPFENMSGQPEDDYFADGVTEDIITALAYVPWVFVIARNSSFSYRGLSVDVRRIGQDLGVRYVLQGSIRHSRTRIRIAAQLIDAETGAHIWANRYDGVLDDIFDLQDEISTAVVEAIAPEIQNAEIERVLRKPTDNLDAYDMYLRGQHALHLGRMESATEWFTKTLDAAPTFAKARAIRAWMPTLWHYYGLSVDGDMRRESLALAREALEQSPGDPDVMAYAGYTIGFLNRDPSFGLDLVEQATAKCPSFAWAWASSALLSAYVGAGDQALERARTAQRLSPRDRFAFRLFVAQCLGNLINGDFQALLDTADIGVQLNPGPINFHYHRAIALAQLGRNNEANRARDRVLTIDPGFSIESYMDYCRTEIGTADPLNNPLEAGFRAAGFPE